LKQIECKVYYSVGRSPCRENPNTPHKSEKGLQKHEIKSQNHIGEILTTHTPKIFMTKTKKTLVKVFLTGLASVPLLLGLTAQAQSSITNGLVAYWNFDAQDFKDSVGTFDGTQNGANPIAFVAGKPGFGQAIQLDGVDQFVEITGRDATYDPDQLAFEGGSISIAGWFTVGTFDKSWQALIAKGEGSNWRVHRRGSGTSMSYAGGVGEGADDLRPFAAEAFARSLAGLDVGR